MIYYNIPLTFYRGVEQLVVRQAHNLEVTGSSPVPATNFLVAQDASVIRTDISSKILISENLLLPPRSFDLNRLVPH